jgi:UTP--glucose-1-phosphate uridylyltransferase
MLPATKAVPKEMLPIVDKPLIQYAVEEAVEAGIDEVIFVIAEGKEAIRAHFGSGTRADSHARASGDAELVERVCGTANLAKFSYVRQDKPKGIAHAVSCARSYLEGAPFALMFPDDIILGARSCVAQMVDAYTGGSMIAAHDVPRAEVPQYGIMDIASEGNPFRLKGLIEKPRLEDAPSTMAIVGRYILSETIFAHIDRIPPGKNGELQITDALASQIAAGEAVYGFLYEGRRYDTGRPVGYLEAQTAAALLRPDIAESVRERIAALLEA